MSQSVDAHIQQLPSELNAGALSIAVRKDTAGTLQATDGQPSALQVDSSGALRVTGSTGGSSGGAITSVVPGTGADNLGKETDTASHSDATGVLMLGVRSDRSAGALATSLVDTNGDYAPFSMNAEGSVRVEESCRNIRTSITIASNSWSDGSTEGAMSLDGHRAVDFAIQLDSSGSATDFITIEMSSDGSTFYPMQDISAVAATDSVGSITYVIRGGLTGIPTKHIRFANRTGMSLGVSSPLFITRHN